MMSLMVRDEVVTSTPVDQEGNEARSREACPERVNDFHGRAVFCVYITSTICWKPYCNR